MVKDYDEMSNAELLAFVDGHLLMALIAAEKLEYSRQPAEDYLRNRLVAISDDFPTDDSARTEDSRRRTNRLRGSLGLPAVEPEPEKRVKLSPERRAQRTARDINWGLIAGAGVQQPRAFNDPVVDCCGRDAANCDCPTHHLVPRGNRQVCTYCKVPASELGRDATQLGCPKGPR